MIDGLGGSHDVRLLRALGVTYRRLEDLASSEQYLQDSVKAAQHLGDRDVAAKVDAFAATLDPEEQAMLIDLLCNEAEVHAFGAIWPGLRNLGVWKAPAGTEADGSVVMSGGTTMVVSASDEAFDPTTKLGD